MPDAPARQRFDELSDEQLVEHVRAGSSAAARTLFARHQETLLAFCRHMLGRRSAGEDAVVESFRHAIAALRKHDRPVHLNAVLFAGARNRCLVHRAEAGDHAETVGLHPEVRRDPELRGVLHALGALPPEQRAALLLVEIGRHSHEEIATIVGCTGEKVDALVAQARRAVAGEEEPGDWTCAQARSEMAARGGEARREAVRRHIAECAACIAFRETIARQRRLLAIVVPVAPSPALEAPELEAARVPAAARAPEAPATPARPARRVNRTTVSVVAAAILLAATVAVGAALTGGRAPAPGVVAPSSHGHAAGGDGHGGGSAAAGGRAGVAAGAGGGAGLVVRAAREARRVTRPPAAAAR